MKFKKIISFLLILCFAFTVMSCGLNTVKTKYTSVDFDPFMNEVFTDEVQSDSITLNYTLQSPENYDITDYVPTFGEYSAKEIKEGHAQAKKYLKKLKEFDYSTLSKEQKVTYDVLYEYLEDHSKNDDLIYYNEILGPTTGIQAQLPVLLAEYHFYEKQDIVDYLELLTCINQYFDEIVTFEQEKSKKGLFMSDTTATEVISQCEDFISSPNDNYLITYFNQKLDDFEGLTDEEKANFKTKNQNAILTNVIPAYQSLIKGLTALKGTGENSKGLSNFKKGKDYYEYLIKTIAGSSRTPKEINKLLDNTVKNCLVNISQIAKDDSDILTKLQNYSYPLTEPSDILTYLEGAVSADFPTVETAGCSIKSVDKSLQEHLSPAFYLTPAIDYDCENCIYINESDKYDLSEIFPTVAHEGCPGHMYQNCYYKQTDPAPIRTILNFEGYSEGWATYAELYSYSISGLDTSISSLLTENSIATLCIYAKCDLGINYYNWSLKDTSKYLKSFGLSDAQSFQTIFNAMIAEPCSYLKYTLGYLEIEVLRDDAKDKLGDNFDAKSFHQYILDMGPCQFDILEKYLDSWIKKQ